MYGERERERERKEKKTRRGRENRGGRDGSKVEVKKRSERKGVVGKIHLFEKRYRVTSDDRPSLTSLPFFLPLCLLLSILFSPFSFLSLLPFPPFDMRACPPFRSTSSPSPSRFFYVPSVVPSPQARLPRGEHEPRTSRAVAQNLAGEFFPWKWLIERAPVQTRGYRGLFPLFCERLVLLLASLTLHAGPP